MDFITVSVTATDAVWPAINAPIVTAIVVIASGFINYYKGWNLCAGGGQLAVHGLCTQVLPMIA